MKAAQRKALDAYVRWLANEVGLRDWTIRIDRDADGSEGAMASVRVVRGRKFAAIRLGADWATFTPDEVRHTLVHELVHAHTAPLDFIVEDTADALGSHAYAMLVVGWNLAHETTVDALADVIAPHMPLPSPLAMGVVAS